MNHDKKKKTLKYAYSFEFQVATSLQKLLRDYTKIVPQICWLRAGLKALLKVASGASR